MMKTNPDMLRKAQENLMRQQSAEGAGTAGMSAQAAATATPTPWPATPTTASSTGTGSENDPIVEEVEDLGFSSSSN